MFGHKNNTPPLDSIGGNLFDLMIGEVSGPRGKSPPNSSIKSSDPGVPPVPETVGGGSWPRNQDSVKKLSLTIEIY